MPTADLIASWRLPILKASRSAVLPMSDIVCAGSTLHFASNACSNPGKGTCWGSVSRERGVGAGMAMNPETIRDHARNRSTLGAVPMTP